MVINRFFYEGSIQDEVILEKEEHEHLAKVVRASVGARVEIVDGRGSLAEGCITALARHKTTIAIEKKSHSLPTPHPITLIQGICRQNRLDLLLEKGTELGVDHFIFIPMERSEKRPISEERLERMRRITLSALKQCGRLYLPSLSLLPSLEAIKGQNFYFGDLSEKAPSLISAFNPSMTTFVAGPESGFSQREEEWLAAHGCGVRLHPYILRCETAGMAAAAILSHLTAYGKPAGASLPQS